MNQLVLPYGGEPRVTASTLPGVIRHAWPAYSRVVPIPKSETPMIRIDTGVKQIDAKSGVASEGQQLTGIRFQMRPDMIARPEQIAAAVLTPVNAHMMRVVARVDAEEPGLISKVTMMQNYDQAYATMHEHSFRTLNGVPVPVPPPVPFLNAVAALAPAFNGPPGGGPPAGGFNGPQNGGGGEN